VTRGLFITGTDTGVGKTVVGVAVLRALVAAGWSAIGMKPVAAGRAEGEAMNADVAALIAAASLAAPRADVTRVEAAVRRWEPPNALFAGASGLEALEHIVAGAPRHLVPGGWLALEHGDTQGEPVRRQLEAEGFEEVRTHRDLAGRERCSEGRLAVTSRR